MDGVYKQLFFPHPSKGFRDEAYFRINLCISKNWQQLSETAALIAPRTFMTQIRQITLEYS